MKGIFLLLGSNIGDKESHLKSAIEKLEDYEVIMIDFSSVYETAPWGNTNQDWFLNMVIRVDTLLSPLDLMKVCQQVELEMGRKRVTKWGAREIDIDLLYFDNMEIQLEDLTLPHPGIAVRRFTLLPLVELVPEEYHPILQLTQKELLDRCEDTTECIKTDLLKDL